MSTQDPAPVPATLPEPAIEDEIVRALRQIMRAVDLQSRRLTEEFGLTGPQLIVLMELARSGPVTPTRLARSVHLSNATMTGICARLVNRGLVTRNPGKRDRRTVEYAVSEAGRAVLESAPSPLQDVFRTRLLALEEWERLQILATLKRVAGMMQADGIEAAPVLDAGALGPGAAGASSDPAPSPLTPAPAPERDTPELERTP